MLRPSTLLFSAVFIPVSLLARRASAMPLAKSSAIAKFPPDFYFAQLQIGKDVALDAGNPVHKLAGQMQNFIYLLGDKNLGEAVAVDAAWDLDGIQERLQVDNMTLREAVCTHYHWDHIGGPVRGLRVPGIRELASAGLPVRVPWWERQDAADSTGTPLALLTPIQEAEVIRVGRFRLRFIHTPGHSPGSMCIHVQDERDADIALITGDTLFPGSCGRLDLPGSDPSVMLDSLGKLARLSGALPVFPGHAYGGWGSTIDREKREGLLQPMSTAQFYRSMGLQPPQPPAAANHKELR